MSSEMPDELGFILAEGERFSRGEGWGTVWCSLCGRLLVDEPSHGLKPGAELCSTCYARAWAPQYTAAVTATNPPTQPSTQSAARPTFGQVYGKRPDQVACPVCKRRPIQVKGLCSTCYHRARNASRAASPLATWASRGLQGCAECGRSDVPHAAAGLCERCYHAWRYRA
jgi:hypothetical protein